LSREGEGEAGYGIFAHSRPDKIGTARLLPLYIWYILNGLSAKETAQIPYPASRRKEMIAGEPYRG